MKKRSIKARTCKDMMLRNRYSIHNNLMLNMQTDRII